MNNVHHQHHHLHNPAEHVEGHNEAKLALLGLGAAAAFGPIGLIVAGGVGATALGTAWLIARARARSLDTSNLSRLLAVDLNADRLSDDQMRSLAGYLSEYPFLFEPDDERVDNSAFLRRNWNWLDRASSDD